MKRVLLMLVAIIMGLGTMGEAQLSNPLLKWYTIETEHFSVTYHEGLEEQALLTARGSEEAWDYWVGKLQYEPSGKIEVVVLDITDGPNGFANLVPNLQFVDFASVSGAMTGFANSETPSPEDLLALHELGHAIELDFVSGLSQTLRNIVGRAAIPGAFEPTLLIEGIPTYGEYEFRGASRANDARVAMMLRSMMLENNYPTMQEASVYYQRDEWPGVGSISHDVGPWFIRYLEDTYGTDTYRQIKVAQTSHPLWALGSLAASYIPAFGGLGIGGDFSDIYKEVTGKGGDELWAEFKVWVNEQFSEQVSQIQEAGITPSRQLTNHGYFSGGTFNVFTPTWSPDGEYVYYFHFSPGRAGGIRRVKADGTGDEAVIQGAGNWNILPDGSGAVFTRGVTIDRYYGRNDLFHYDFETGKETRLTENGRPISVSVGPDSNTVVFAKNNWGTESPSLVSLDIASGEMTDIQSFQKDFVIENMSLSPDGSTIAMSAFRYGGFADIYTMPAGGGELTAITQDKATDMQVFWSPDGQHILWSSDRTEVHNIYAHNVSTGQSYQVTNVLTGALTPRISPDGTQLMFTGYSSQGYDIHVMDVDMDAWTSVTFDHETIPEFVYPSRDDYEIRDYNPIQSLLPKLWFPSYSNGQVGVNTFGTDALFAQNYSLTGGWDMNAEAPFGNFFYGSSVFPVNFGVFGGFQSAGYFAGGNANYPLVIANGFNVSVAAGYQRAQFGQLSETISGTLNIGTFKSFDLWNNGFNISTTGMMNIIEGLENPIQRAIVNVNETMKLPLENPNTISLSFTGGWSDAPAPEMGYALGQGQFGLRGFVNPGQIGQMAAAGTAQYNFRITPIEQGISLWPLFFDDLGGSVFVDAGTAGTELSADNLKISFGFELSLSTNTNPFGGPTFTLGIAQGVGEAGPQIYFGM